MKDYRCAHSEYLTFAGPSFQEGGARVRNRLKNARKLTHAALIETGGQAGQGARISQIVATKNLLISISWIVLSGFVDE